MSSTPAPAAPAWQRLRPLRWALLALLLLAAALLGGALWLWHSEAGMSRVLQQVPGLRITGQQGRPNGGPFAVKRLEWQRGGLHVIVHDLAWDDAQWRWRPHPGAWAGFQLQQPRAARVQVINDAPAGDPAQPPASLRLPVEVQAPGLRIGSLEVGEQPAIGPLAADLHLGAVAGAEHRVEQLEFMRGGLVYSGRATLGSDGELPLQARLAVATAPDATPAWRAEVQAQGPLQRVELEGRLDHASGAAATAQATLAPFAPWPLRALAARVNELDLATLSPAWPQTRLSGHAVLAEPGSAQTAAPDLTLDLDLDNTEAGPWDAGRLPLRALQVRLHGRPSEPGSLVFEQMEARLAGSPVPGTLRGGGRWHDGRLTLQMQLDAVQPQHLDTRLPPMTLGGPVTLTLGGLPAAGAAPAAGSTGWQGELHVDLRGRLPRRGAPALSLQAQGGFELAPDGSMKLELRQAQARAGDGRNGGTASATASAERSTDGGWRLRTRGELLRFDPAPWWPAAAVGRGPHRLNGDWQADLTLPAASASGTGMLPALRGGARLTLHDSRWAGVDWRGQADLQATALALQGTAGLQAGRNRVQARGSLPHGGGASVPSAEIDVQAPDLAALAPLRSLVPGAAEAWPRQGSLTASATVQGRWPELRSQGTLRARGVNNASVRLGQADARWNLSTAGADEPLSLQLEVADLSSGAQRLGRLDATLQGSLREHTWQVRASSPLRPPAWAEAAAGVPAPGGSSLQLLGSGRWSPAARGGGTWRGRVAQLQAAPRAAPGTPWLSATGLQAELTLGDGGRLLRAGLAPGRIDAFGGALSWQQASWQAGASPGAVPLMQLQARLAPMQVAPWLARWQPQFGWRGDLAVAGRIDVRSGEQFDADVVIERSGGDLSFTAEGVTRSLALSDLRLGLAAHGGQWQFTQALVGRNVGVVGGLQTLRTSARAVWPEASAPLSGGLSLIVPQLAVWAPWLPPGWRLGGEMRVGASFAGSLGAPEYRGDISGENLSVRNLFEGIHLQQGVLAVALIGTQATIQRLEFRDGAAEGVLRVSGGASFGDTPRAQLRVTAERLRLLDRYDRRISVSGAADLDLQAERVALAGSFTIDEGLVDATQADAPKLGTDVIVVNRAPLVAPGPGGAPAVPPPGPPSSPLGQADVDLRIDLGQNLRLRGRGLDTLLRGQLRVTTPDGKLAVNGVVRAEQGTYAAYGQNLAIERGTVIFRGDLTNPQLDILALRPDIDVRVGVVVSGSAINPRVRLYSGSESGDMDTLTWLVLGRAPEGLDRDDTALLQRAALALLAGERGDSTGLMQQLGLDELTLGRRNVDGATETIVSLGKQISRRLYVGYEHALGSAGGTWQLIYRVAGRLTLRARTGYENAIDAIWTWRWD